MAVEGTEGRWSAVSADSKLSRGKVVLSRVAWQRIVSDYHFRRIRLPSERLTRQARWKWQ